MRKVFFMLLLLLLVSCSHQNTVSEGSEVPETKVESGIRFEIEKGETQTKAEGVPFDIVMNNCGGTTAITQSQTETRSYQTKLQIDVSQSVAAELGVSIDVAEAILRDEIGVQLGVRFGSDTTSSSSIEIEVPPASKTITTLQWSEEWLSGKVSIIRPDGQYVAVLPFSALNNVSLVQLGTQVVNCDKGENIEGTIAVATPEITTPNVPVIVPTPTPAKIGSLTLPGNSSEGLKFTATEAGTYTFEYVEGAYSTYPKGSNPPGVKTWLTAYRVFLNRPPEWNGIAISNHPDYSFADYNFQSSASEAESKAQGFSLSVRLLKGDYLIFVPVDEKPYYSDNPGEVIVDVYFTP